MYAKLTKTLKSTLKSTAILTTCLVALSTASSANDFTSADTHAPIGVMGDHAHKTGEFMFSYRYMKMEMNDNYSGNSKVTNAQVLNDFMVTPTDMTMEMHMFGGMYGVSDDLTLMAMVPYIDKSMNHLTRMGGTFRTTAKGFGDVKLGGLYTLYQGGEHDHEGRPETKALLLNMGLSLPTGSIDERGTTPAGTDQRLPYPMQLGSGTVDPTIGLTYAEINADFSWGAQALTTVRFGKNDEGYRLGNEYQMTGWLAKPLSNALSVSARLDAKAWKDIKGMDGQLNQALVATARPDLRGGYRVNANLGVNYLHLDGPLKGHRLAAEFGMPVYQNLDGPQLGTDYNFTLGWQYAF